ncbi:MAG: hypothetical protein RLZZ196_2949 [Bacteroidota bacterium]|jgi:hypothetical protein
MKRTPLKRKPGPIGKPNRIKRKPPTVEKLEADKKESEKDREFYNRIWQSRPHRCVVCNVSLGSEMKTAYMDHGLEKSKYKNLRYEPLNILLVCFECHQKKTNGFLNEKYKQLIDEIKSKFLE